MLFWTPHFSVLGTPHFSFLDSTFWLDSTLKIDRGLSAVRSSRGGSSLGGATVCKYT